MEMCSQNINQMRTFPVQEILLGTRADALRHRFSCSYESRKPKASKPPKESTFSALLGLCSVASLPSLAFRGWGAPGEGGGCPSLGRRSWRCSPFSSSSSRQPSRPRMMQSFHRPSVSWSPRGESHSFHSFVRGVTILSRAGTED